MGKHVIILGAGASYTSGYPLAADLRILLSSKSTFEEYLREKFNRPDVEGASSAMFEHLRKWYSEQSIAKNIASFEVIYSIWEWFRSPQVYLHSRKL